MFTVVLLVERVGGIKQSNEGMWGGGISLGIQDSLMEVGTKLVRNIFYFPSFYIFHSVRSSCVNYM